MRNERLCLKGKGGKTNVNATLGFLGFGSSRSLAGNVLGLAAHPRLRTLDIASAVATSPSGPLRS